MKLTESHRTILEAARRSPVRTVQVTSSVIVTTRGVNTFLATAARQLALAGKLELVSSVTHDRRLPGRMRIEEAETIAVYRLVQTPPETA